MEGELCRSPQLRGATSICDGVAQATSEGNKSTEASPSAAPAGPTFAEDNVLTRLTLDGRELKLGERLGRGRYADVYAAGLGTESVVVKIAAVEAVDVADGTGAFACAVALLRVTGGFVDAPLRPDAIVRLEAIALGGLTSPPFPRLLGTGSGPVDGVERTFLVTERILGKTFREATVTLEHFRKLAAILGAPRTLAALPFHGDLKPDNLMLGEDGGVHVLDPSSQAWKIDGGRVEEALFTPLYNPWAEPSDVPAFALTACECLLGVNPLLHADDRRPPAACTGALATIFDAALAVGKGPELGRLLSAPRISELAPGCPPAFELAVYRALHLRLLPSGTFDWDDGFPTVAALLQALVLGWTGRALGLVMSALDDLPELDEVRDDAFHAACDLARRLAETRRARLVITGLDAARSIAELSVEGTTSDIRNAFAQVVALVHVGGHTQTSAPIGDASLTVTANGDELWFSLDTGPASIAIRRDVALAAWNTTLSVFVDSVLGRLRQRTRADQIFAGLWESTQTLFRSGRAWYADPAKLELVFPHAPEWPPPITLTEYLRRTIDFDIEVGGADRTRARETATAYWIGGDEPRAAIPLMLRLASWLASAPDGSHLWCIDGNRLVVIAKKLRGAAVFIDTFGSGSARPLDSVALLRNRLQRYLFLRSTFPDAFVMDHGEVRE